LFRKLEKSELEREREKIRELHQRQQDSIKILEALEAKFRKATIDDEDTLSGSTTVSRILTFNSMAIPFLPIKKIEKETDSQFRIKSAMDTSSLTDDSEMSDSESTVTDEEAEHLTLDELSQCAKHVQKLLKKISTLQETFETTKPARRLPKTRVHKLYRRFCLKFESQVTPRAGVTVQDSLLPLPAFVPPSKLEGQQEPTYKTLNQNSPIRDALEKEHKSRSSLSAPPHRRGYDSHPRLKTPSVIQSRNQSMIPGLSNNSMTDGSQSSSGGNSPTFTTPESESVLSVGNGNPPKPVVEVHSPLNRVQNIKVSAPRSRSISNYRNNERAMMEAEAYMSRMRGSDKYNTDKVKKTAKNASSVVSSSSEFDSESIFTKTRGGAHKENRMSIPDYATTTNGDNGGEIRLRVDAFAPLNHQFNGDMEDRTIQIDPVDNTMTDIKTESIEEPRRKRVRPPREPDHVVRRDRAQHSPRIRREINYDESARHTAAIKRRPTISDDRNNNPRKPLQRAGSVSRKPRERRQTIQTQEDDDCTNPNCITCGPNATPSSRGQPSPLNSAVDLSYQQNFDVRSQRPPSPTYARPAPYQQGPALIQTASTHRRSSVSRPVSFHGGESGGAYWGVGLHGPLYHQEQRGPPPSASAHFSSMHNPDMAPYMAPPLQPNYYPQAPLYDSQTQRPQLHSRTSSSYNSRGRPLSYGPPLVTQESNAESMPSARYAAPPQSARPALITQTEFESESSDEESESKSEPEVRPSRKSHKDRAIMPPPPSVPTRTPVQRRPSIRHAATTQSYSSDHRMSQSQTLVKYPQDFREQDPREIRSNRASTAAPVRAPSKARPALIQQPKAQSALESTHNAGVYIENTRSGRRQSYNGYEKEYQAEEKAQRPANRNSKIYDKSGPNARTHTQNLAVQPKARPRQKDLDAQNPKIHVDSSVDSKRTGRPEEAYHRKLARAEEREQEWREARVATSDSREAEDSEEARHQKQKDRIGKRKQFKSPEVIPTRISQPFTRGPSGTSQDTQATKRTGTPGRTPSPPFLQAGVTDEHSDTGWDYVGSSPKASQTNIATKRAHPRDLSNEREDNNALGSHASGRVAPVWGSDYSDVLSIESRIPQPAPVPSASKRISQVPTPKISPWSKLSNTNQSEAGSFEVGDEDEDGDTIMDDGGNREGERRETTSFLSSYSVDAESDEVLMRPRFTSKPPVVWNGGRGGSIDDPNYSTSASNAGYYDAADNIVMTEGPGTEKDIVDLLLEEWTVVPVCQL
jgi:hypothetical protein